MTTRRRQAHDHPDLALPERGAVLGAVSVRVDATADLVTLISLLRDTGAEIVHEPVATPAAAHDPGRPDDATR